MGAKKHSESNLLPDRKISLSVQQLITFSITLITIGASIYTLIQALPRIERLDTSIQQLKESNARVDQRITDLKEVLMHPNKK